MQIKPLSMKDREEIREGWQHGDSAQEIAYRLKVSVKTIYRELERGRTNDFDFDHMRYGYDPELGAQVYLENIKRRGNRTSRASA